MQRPNQRQPEFDVSAAPELASAWMYSADRYDQIREAIHQCLPEFVACVAASGSLARMEAHAGSDIDLIIVIDDRYRSVSDTEATAAVAQVWDRLDALGAARPKAGGIFSVCARWKDLIDPEMKGRIDESIVTFGHRIQLLMDAQPVIFESQFLELQKEILVWYSETRVASIFEEAGPFHWLWQDVHRYWRSLRSRTCWLNADDDAKSLTLNVKLRSSRLLLVFGFLKALDACDCSRVPLETVVDDLTAMLSRTPVERVLLQRESIACWNSIWEFIRNMSVHSVSQLPPQILSALSELGAAVIERTGNSVQPGYGHRWLM
ncbi:MAG: DUF294 nucleotidyltransferase-like domain-containing protein [Fuerstiella sp.]|nr:DUF294 nucleotidyltransferase-like domain-containing protein [Fuerstiella sp.]